MNTKDLGLNLKKEFTFMDILLFNFTNLHLLSLLSRTCIHLNSAATADQQKTGSVSDIDFYH